MENIKVELGKDSYTIAVERGLWDTLGQRIRQVSQADKAAILTDASVDALYGAGLEEKLRAAGFDVRRLVMPPGEDHKNLETFTRMVRECADFGMTRKDLVISLGGGVPGDLGGYVAASYLRGVAFIQIPTTLLSQIDSSVGGKVAVDLPEGKNLVGAFHQPIAVLIDPDTLNTLPDRFITDGMGEVIKYGCIKDAKFFEFLENENALEHIEDVIETCVSIKRDVVSRDEHEKGERMILNFGHTLGHAIEKLYDFSGISHGMAVAVGMVMLAKAGEKQGITTEGTADRIAALCKKYSLPTKESFGFEELANAARSDKKSAGDSISLVLLREIGDSFTRKVELDGLEDFIATE